MNDTKEVDKLTLHYILHKTQIDQFNDEAEQSLSRNTGRVTFRHDPKENFVLTHAHITADIYTLLILPSRSLLTIGNNWLIGAN